MNLPYLQTHWDSALVLFRQRSAWSSRPLDDAAPLERLEQRLRLHFYVLGRCPETLDRKPDKAPDCFVWLASQLSAEDPSVRRSGYQQAYDLLVAGGAKGLGAFLALSLFCPPEADQGCVDLYRSHESLRPILFSLWREQGYSVPKALYNRAELQSSSPDLQQAALAYAADNPKVSLELFRAYYQPLLGVTRPKGLASEAISAALRGGLLRGDPELPKALRRAIELEPSPEKQLPLLRLTALSGDRESYPILRSCFATDLQNGAGLLALHGSPEALDDLFAGLGQAQAMEPAAQAWRWLAGQQLGRKPRLSLVGGADVEASGETMPDIEAAGNWLEENRAGLKEQDRFFRGQPLAPQSLMDTCLKLAGQGDADMLDLLSFKLQRPLGLTVNSWRSERRRILGKLPVAPQEGTAVPSNSVRKGQLGA